MNKQNIARQARAFSVAAGSPVGVRGRLSLGAFAAYLMAHPRTAREIATTVGVPVSKRGRLSSKHAYALAEIVR